MNVVVRIVHEAAPAPGPVPEGKAHFYVTVEFDKADLQKIAPAEREKELEDTVWSLFAAVKKRVVAHLLEQVKETS